MSIVDDLEEEIRQFHDKIVAIQEICSHPEEAVTKTYQSNQGNYDPSCDSFWIDYYCSLCKKRWTTPQGEINDSK